MSTPSCIADPLEHGSRFTLEHYGAVLRERLGRPATSSDLRDTPCVGAEAFPDIDGDGAPETVVVEGCSWGIHGALHLLYLSRNGCRTFGGDLVSGELRPLGTERSGMKDLEATWSNGNAGQDAEWTLYRWTGNRYAVERRATRRP